MGLSPSIRALLRSWLPPELVRLVLRRNRVTWSGDYRSWDEAARACVGYTAPDILEKVCCAARRVKRGEAAFERDSVVFSKPDYSWPLLAILLWIASLRDGRLRLIDFGGSLGSSYFQHRPLLSGLKELKWYVVEQPHVVTCGKAEFEDDSLRFFKDIDKCLEAGPAHALLLSSVLPYVEAPYRLLDEIYSHKVRHIIIDRTPFLLSGDEDRLTVQRVPPSIYSASYPAWFFNRDRFETFVRKKYRILASFQAPDRANIPSRFQGYLLELNSERVERNGF
jgi:putative methyltransferase (TIGR04325 family)